MPQARIRVEGGAAFDAALDDLARRLHAATRSAVREGIRHTRRRAHAELSRYYHPPNTPTPSPPGEPPARIGGHLRGSLSPTGPVPTSGGYTGRLGPTAVYGRIQELGGQAGRGHRSTLPARPYLRPAVRRSIADGSLRRIFADAWGRAM